MTQVYANICPKCKCETPLFIHNGERFRCKVCNQTFLKEKLLKKPVEYKSIAGKKFVITSAVNNTHVNSQFLASLRHYCKVEKAQLIVIPVRYKNPTSEAEAEKLAKKEWWDEKIKKDLYGGTYELGHKLMLFGNVPIQPTATRPLSGLQSFGGAKSAIFGHPKVAIEFIPTRLNKEPKAVFTTGAVTKSNYSRSKAGLKGDFHHVIGAVVVEIGEDAFHFRHISAGRDGSFYDLNKQYFGDKVKPAQAKVLVCGDLHAVRAAPEVLDQTFFAKDSMLKVLKPKYVILHDVLDFQSQSHHNNFIDNVRLHAKKAHYVRDEVEITFKLVDKILDEDKDIVVVIVPSNHHEHMCKWLLNPNNANDPANAAIYHRTKLAWIEAAERGEDFDPFQYWGNQLLKNKNRVIFLMHNESFVLNDVEFGLHGDIGVNGARGSRNSFLNLGSKMVIGHSHTSGVTDGIYQVGTSSVKNMGYNKGLSSWMWTHLVMWGNGKRSLLNIIRNAWKD